MPVPIFFFIFVDFFFLFFFFEASLLMKWLYHTPAIPISSYYTILYHMYLFLFSSCVLVIQYKVNV